MLIKVRKEVVVGDKKACTTEGSLHEGVVVLRLVFGVVASLLAWNDEKGVCSCGARATTSFYSHFSLTTISLAGIRVMRNTYHG